MSTPRTEVQRDLKSAATSHRGDRVFNRSVTTMAFTALAVLAGISIFLGAQAVPVFQELGFSYLTTTAWDLQASPPEAGIFGMLYGSVLLAVIGLVIAVPAALLLAIFMVFIAPPGIAKALTNVVDLMAAVPSVIIGLWAFYVLNPVAVQWEELLNQYLGWIPIFQNISREVLARTPPELINASESLGGSLWTMLRYVALPYGRGGIIGGIMLGLGRALGETIAIFFVLKIVFDTNWYQIIESGGGSVASLIVSKFGEANAGFETQLLLAAGFFLFLLTLIVNVIANLIVSRSGKLQR